MEQTAVAAAEERFDNTMVGLITAETKESFEQQYEHFVDAMIAIGNWKAIYEEKQKRWIGWMKSTKYDDRASLKTVRPLPAWKQIMGWEYPPEAVPVPDVPKSEHHVLAFDLRSLAIRVGKNSLRIHVVRRNPQLRCLSILYRHP